MGMAKNFDLEDNTIVYVPTGCDHCEGSGYFGRVAIAESIQIDSRLKNMIHESASEQEISKYAFTDNQPIDQLAKELIINGLTSSAELLRIKTQKEDASI
jgi:general secretion pathway protein E